MEIGIIGGTGKQGSGLARRLARAGYQVKIGSRRDEKGKDVAKSFGLDNLTGGTNEFAANADIVVLTIPADQIEVLIEPLKPVLEGKLVIDTIINLKFGKTVESAPFHGTSVYDFLKSLLDHSIVVTAFKTISAALLGGEQPLNQSDFIITEDDEIFEKVSALSRSIGLQPLKVSSAYHAATLERMVALSIQLNKSYKGSHCGYLISDIKS